MEIGVRIFEVCMWIVTIIWMAKACQENKGWSRYDYGFSILVCIFLGYSLWSNGFNRGSKLTGESARTAILKLEKERGCPIKIDDLPIGIEITAVLIETGPVIGSEKSGSLYLIFYKEVPRMKILYTESTDGKVLPLYFRIERHNGNNLKVIPVQPSLSIS